MSKWSGSTMMPVSCRSTSSPARTDRQVDRPAGTREDVEQPHGIRCAARRRSSPRQTRVRRSSRPARLGADVQCRDAECQRVGLHVLQASRREQVDHRRPVRELHHARRQVAVGVVAIRRDRLAEPRAGSAGRRRGRTRRGPCPAAARTPGSPPSRPAWRRGSSRRCRGPCRRRCGARTRPSRRRTCRSAPAGPGSRPRRGGCGASRVESPSRGRWRAWAGRSRSRRSADLPRPALVIFEGEVGGARAAIEDGHAGLGRDGPRGESPPGFVDIQAEQVIEQVVLARDRREHRPDAAARLVDPRLFGFGDEVHVAGPFAGREESSIVLSARARVVHSPA